jgi:hypothetical protein
VFLHKQINISVILILFEQNNSSISVLKYSYIYSRNIFIDQDVAFISLESEWRGLNSKIDLFWFTRLLLDVRVLLRFARINMLIRYYQIRANSYCLLAVYGIDSMQ